MAKVEVKIKRTCNISTLRGQPIPEGKQFSEIYPFYSVKTYRGSDYGVIQHLNIYELKDYINNYEKGLGKADNGFLKGIYKGGTNSTFCVRNSEYLFYDIDIKEANENTELFNDQHLRSRLIQELKKYSVLLGRSNSGIGIFGVIHVKDLQYISDTVDHRVIAEHVYRYLENNFKELGIPVKFDIAQGKYRQVRFVAWQKEKIEVNKKAFTISYDLKKVEQEISVGAPDYQFTGGHTIAGSIRDKFNNDNPIETLLPAAGLTLVSGTRYKYELSQSSTSGEVKDGNYINNSTTFSSQTFFDSFAMAARIKNFTLKQMYAHLYEKGYRDDEINVEKIKAGVKEDLTPQEIFELCYPLRYKPVEEKMRFLAEANITPDQRVIFEAYLNMKKLTITYDEHIKIEKWVSEVIDIIFDRSDEKRKIIVASETGTGKSTAILKHFRKLRPDKRLLFIVPLTAIVDQLVDPSDLDMVGLKGGAPEAAFNLANEVSIVIATHEQATKLLGYKSGFDYIIRDEIHSDIVGCSFKSGVIGKLNKSINNYGDVPIIGLTGTPLNVFKEKGLDFYLIKLDSGKPVNIVTQRTDNRQAVKVILQHQKGVDGKAFYRANSKESLKAVRRQLVKDGYSYNEIKILDASRERKDSDTFRRLVEKSVFDPSIKIVLTTSVIDEGVSIKNNDFTDIVFIDKDYHPRPEPLKQFLNRFRNANEDTKYYHYRKTPEEQSYRQYTNVYDEDIKTLGQLVKDTDFFDYNTFKSFVSNDKFYHEDGTINFYYLAYKNTRDFFSLLNNSEYNEFIETNYNIKFQIDELYATEDIDVKKRTPAEVRAERTEIYNKLKEDLVSIVIHNTADKNLQQSYGMDSMSDYALIPENDKKLIKDNISYFESLLRARLDLDRILPEEHIEQFLFNVDKQLDSSQKINRKISFLNNQRTLERKPKNKRDAEAQANLKRFLDKVNSSREPPTKTELESYLQEIKVIDIPINSSYNIADFIAANTDFMYEPKKARYISQTENPERKSKLIEKWMQPILSPENTKKKLATQLLIPFKN